MNDSTKSQPQPSGQSGAPPVEAASRSGIGSSIGMKLLALLLFLLPISVVYLFALIPVTWYYLLRPEGRRSAAVLHQSLGLAGGVIRRFVFGFRQAVEYSKIILDNLYLGMFGPDKFTLEEHGTDVFKKALEGGRGLILISAHVGNWHLAVNFLSNTDTHVHLVMDDVRQEEVRRQMDAAKQASHHLTVRSAREGPALVFELSAALKRGEVVIIAGDRSTSDARRTQIPFLGKPAWFPTAAFSLADRVGSPVCTAFTFRTGVRRYVCHGLGPFDPPGHTDDPRVRTTDMTAQFVHHLETYVRQYPLQWFNFFDFWKD